MCRRSLVAAVLGAVVVVLAAAGPASAESQPSWLGTTHWTDYFEPKGLGDGRPDAIAYSPDGRDVIAVRASDETSSRVRVVVVRQSSRTGRLTRLEGERGCLALPAAEGCRSLPPMPRGITQVVASPDGRAVHVVGEGVVTLARDPESGGLAPLPGGGCLPTGARGCGGPGLATRLVQPTAARAVAMAGGRLVALGALADGSLAPSPTPGACLSDLPSPGCVAGLVPGWSGQALVASGDGRDVYAASAMTGTLVVLHARFTADGRLVEASPAVTVPDACRVLDGDGPGEFEDCVPVAALMAPDGRDVYVTSARHRLIADDDERRSTLLRRDGATGRLTRAACADDGDCPALHPPVAMSPDGDQLYATTYEVVSEAPREGAFVRTYARDADTGRLARKTGRDTGRDTSLVIADGDVPPRELRASPTGRWLTTDSLEVLLRRESRPPRIFVRNLPEGCARRSVRLRISVAGRDAKRATRVSAFEVFGFDRGPDLAARRTRARAFHIRVPRRADSTVEVYVEAPGKARNDISATRTFRFC